MSSGGHFAAMQEPELLAQDIFQFVRLVRGGEYEKEDASRKEL